MVIDDRYRVIRQIGSGSLSAIYHVRDEETQAELILKALAPGTASDQSGSVLKSEFLLLHNLYHPHVIRPRDFGTCTSHGPYFTMQFSGNESLQSLRGVLSTAELRSILLQMGNALEYLRSQGIVHRDISPSNIVVQRESSGSADSQIRHRASKASATAYLIDFGMAGPAGEKSHWSIRGTPSFIAPEILEGSPPDHRSDIYSLGMSIAASLSGVADDPPSRETMRVHPRQPLSLPSNVEQELGSVLRMMTEPSRDSRLSRLDDLAALLNEQVAHDNAAYEPAMLRESLGRVPIQGRDKALSTIVTALRDWGQPGKRHEHRSSRVFLLGGEAGVGKTRLLDEAATRAQTLGFKTCIFRCSEHGREPLELLREQFPCNLAASPQDTQLAAPPDHATLVWLVPTPPMGSTISQAPHDRRTFVSRQPGSNSIQLQAMHELARNIQVASSRKELFLAFEDLQWADLQTLELIRYLSVQQQGPVIMATYQTDRVPNADLETFLGYLVQRANTCTLTLDRLELDDTKKYLSAALGADHDEAALGHHLQQLTGGNPLLLAETLFGLISTGLITRKPAGWDIHFDDIQRCDLPKNLRDFAQSQLRSSTPKQRRLLEFLAVLDTPASHLYLATLAQRDPSSVLADLEALAAMTILVRNQKSQESVYSYRHRCTREFLYNETAPSRRRELHHAIAKSLEQGSPATNTQIIGQIANHYCEALDQQNGPRYAFRAAYLALENASTDKAISFFLKGLDLVPRNDTALRFEGLEAVAALLLMRGDSDRAAKFYQEMLLLARMAAIPAKEALAIRETSRVLIESGDVTRGLAYAQDAAVRFRDLEDAPGEIASVVLCAFALLRKGNSADAEVLARDAFDRAVDLRDIYGQSLARTTQGLISLGLGDYQAALKYQEDALRLKTALNDVVGMTVALNNIGLVHLERNDLPAARVCFERALRDAREKGFALAATLAAGNLGEICLLTGNLKEVEALQMEALALAEGSNRRYYSAYCLCHLGHATALQGSLSRSYEFLMRSESLFKEVSARAELSHALVIKSEMLGLLGRCNEAETAARDALAIAIDLGNPAPVALAKAALAHLLLMKDDVETAHQLISDQQADEARQRVPAHGLCRLLEARAAIDNAQERPARAVERLQHLKSIAREAGLRPDLARGALIEGQALLKLGRRNEARIVLGQEADNARDMGARPLLSHLLYHLAQAQEALDDTAGAADSIFKAAEIVRSLSEEIADVDMRADYLNVPTSAAILQQADQAARKGLRPRPAPDAPHIDPEATVATAFEEISHRLGADAPLRRLLTAALDKAIESIRADRGLMILFEPASAEVTIARNLEGETLADATEYCRSILAEVSQGRSILAIDVPGDQRFSTRRSVTLYQILSLMCIPLRVSDRLVGALYFDSRSGDRLFRQEDLRLMEAFSARVSSAIAEAQENQKLRERAVVINRELAQRYHMDNLIGASPAMQRLFRMMESIIRADCNVLITGESGTGKELVARAIHYAGSRKLSNFVPLDCGAVPETLIESELFGFRRGAFSGADSDKKGLLEEADSGSLFLDEITNTSPAFQAKLLRALQSGEYRRLGETTTRRVDVRIIAATNADIELAIKEGRFREDLFYRLNVVTLQLPPVRERREDIPLLAEHFARRACETRGIKYEGIAQGAMARLSAHLWPGNVRELEHAIEAALVVSGDGMVRREALPLKILGGNLEVVQDLLRVNDTPRGESAPVQAAPTSSPAQPADERALVERALHMAGGDKTQAARLLGWNRMRLYRRLKSLGIPYDLVDDTE